jgi:hypothetical protein
VVLPTPESPRITILRNCFLLLIYNDIILDLLYNSDPYIIRCRILGGEYDNSNNNNGRLPNCFPLIPKMLSPIPKVGETVLLFMYSADDRYSDRFYVGPLISNLNLIDKQTLNAGSTANLSTGFYLPQKDLSKVESVKGVYADYDSNNTYTLNGRDNADIVFKPSEVLIRAGKFISNKPLEFNNVNPAFIQIKNGFNYTDNVNNAIVAITGSGKKSKPQKISVNNIVADKINLLNPASMRVPELEREVNELKNLIEENNKYKLSKEKEYDDILLKYNNLNELKNNIDNINETNQKRITELITTNDEKEQRITSLNIQLNKMIKQNQKQVDKLKKVTDNLKKQIRYLKK